MSPALKFEHGPELFLGFASAVGTDLERVIAKFDEVLERLRYQTFTIRLASLMKELPFLTPNLISEPVDKYIDSHMTQGNELRKITGRNDALAILAIGEIQKIRQEFHAERGQVLERTVYILRSLKHPDEAETLRKVYGRAFYLIVAYAPHDQRRDYLAQRIARSRNDTQMNKYYPDAERLILRTRKNSVWPMGRIFVIPTIEQTFSWIRRMRKCLQGWFRALWN